MAKICAYCGSEIADDKRFCKECGAEQPETAVTETEAEQPAAPESGQPGQPTPAPAPQPVQQFQQPYIQPIAAGKDVPPAHGSKYELISTWEFVGTLLLMGIPIIGWVIVVVWALGGCHKIQKRKFARASIIVFAIIICISLAVGYLVKKTVTKVIQELQSEEAYGGLFDVLLDEDGNLSISGFQELLDGLKDLNLEGLDKETLENLKNLKDVDLKDIDLKDMDLKDIDLDNMNLDDVDLDRLMKE